MGIGEKLRETNIHNHPADFRVLGFGVFCVDAMTAIRFSLLSILLVPS